ncbi:MAG: aminotransferase class V-fold PLP-dependent enzyme [Acidobacteria bacterium]|nr:MAG: aminotransferase class V-fold PLP-dependent enzyme [Acidobacteriota bacterium]
MGPRLKRLTQIASRRPCCVMSDAILDEFCDILRPRRSHDVNSSKRYIRKFEHIGTHPVAIEQALLQAIKFHESLGPKRKEERLRYLKNYWVERVLELPRVVINTPLKDHQSCGIANVAIENISPKAVAEYFYDKHRVFTVAVEQGVRVSPNLFTRLSDLDALVLAIQELAAG